MLEILLKTCAARSGRAADALAGRALRHQYPTKAEWRKYAPVPERPPLTFLTRIFGGRRERERLRPLYDAVVAAGRAPVWYRDGEVPDSVEGRFEMIAATLSLVLLRLEADGEATRRDSVLLTELFIDDMDGSLRQ